MYSSSSASLTEGSARTPSSASPEDMVVELEVGVQQPDQVDVEQVRQQIPYGRCSVRVVHGGLDIPQPHQRGTTTVANVAVVVYLDLEPGDR